MCIKKGDRKMKITFDMDGTIADFYGVNNWLDYLNAEDTTPYKVARPLINMSLLARLLNRAKERGHEIYILSWTSRTGSPDYCARIKEVKLKWIKTHLKSVNFSSIEIVPYGTPKVGEGILFDDEKKNRDTWGEGAHTPEEIFEVLKGLLKE